MFAVAVGRLRRRREAVGFCLEKEGRTEKEKENRGKGKGKRKRKKKRKMGKDPAGGLLSLFFLFIFFLYLPLCKLYTHSS